MSGEIRQGASPYSLWRHNDGQGDARRRTAGKPDKSGSFMYNPPRLKQGYITPKLRDPGPQSRPDDPDEARGQPDGANCQAGVENDQPEITMGQPGEPKVRGQPNKVRGQTTSLNSSLLDYDYGDGATTPIGPTAAPLSTQHHVIVKNNPQQKQQRQELNLQKQHAKPDPRLDGVKKPISSADSNLYVEKLDKGCHTKKHPADQQLRCQSKSKRELEQERHRYNQDQHEQHQQQQQQQLDVQHQQQLETQHKQQQLEDHQQQVEKQLILKLEKQKQLELEKQKHVKLNEHRRNQFQNEQQKYHQLNQYQQRCQQLQQKHRQQQRHQHQQHLDEQFQKQQQQHLLHNKGFGITYDPNPDAQVGPPTVSDDSQIMNQPCPENEVFPRYPPEYPSIRIMPDGPEALHKKFTHVPKTRHSDRKYTKVFPKKSSNMIVLPLPSQRPCESVDDAPTDLCKPTQEIINKKQRTDQDFVVHHKDERQICKENIKYSIPFQRCEPKEEKHSVVQREAGERSGHVGTRDTQSDGVLFSDNEQVQTPKPQIKNSTKRERSDRFRSSFNPNEVMGETKRIVQQNVNQTRANRDRSIVDFNYNKWADSYSKIYDDQKNQRDSSWSLHLQDLQKQRLKESLGLTTTAAPEAPYREPLESMCDSQYEVQPPAAQTYGESNIWQVTHEQRKESQEEVSTFDKQEKGANGKESMEINNSMERCSRESGSRGCVTHEPIPKKQHVKSLVISRDTDCESMVSPRPIRKLVKLFQDIKLFTPKEAAPVRYVSPECGLVTNPLIPIPIPPKNTPLHDTKQPEPPSREEVDSLRSVTQFLLGQRSPQRFLFTSPSCARQTQTVELASPSPSTERQTQTQSIAAVQMEYDAIPVRVPPSIPGVDALVPPIRTRNNRSPQGRPSQRLGRTHSPRSSLATTSPSKSKVHTQRLSPSDSNTGVAHRKAARKFTKKSTTTLV